MLAVIQFVNVNLPFRKIYFHLNETSRGMGNCAVECKAAKAMKGHTIGQSGYNFLLVFFHSYLFLQSNLLTYNGRKHVCEQSVDLIGTHPVGMSSRRTEYLIQLFQAPSCPMPRPKTDFGYLNRGIEPLGV